MATATDTQTLVPAGTWKADPVHSSVEFSVKHMLVSTFRGGFADFDVELTGGDEARLYGKARVASIEVRDENLKTHLLAPEFFDAERHAEIEFSSNAIRSEGDGIVVDGELTIKGTTHEVEARGQITDAVEDPAGGQRIGLDLETSVDRREYGLDWNAPLPKGGVAVENEVTLRINVELVREEA